MQWTGLLRIYSTALGEELAEKDYKDISGSDRQYTRKGERTNTNIMLEHNFIFGGFTLSAGILANKNTGLDNDFRFYPGVDMSYRPNDNWKFYASWNKALRMPTYTDLYISNAVQQGDINLTPEKNSTFKVGTQYRQTGFAATVSGFYAHGTNMIDWVQTSVTLDSKIIGYVRRNDIDENNIYGYIMGCYHHSHIAKFVAASSMYKSIITEVNFSDITPMAEKEEPIEFVYKWTHIRHIASFQMQ